MSIYTEAFHTTIGRLEGSEVALDAGLYRGLGKHVQIDLGAGHTFAGPRPSWFASAGCVFRAPHAQAICANAIRLDREVCCP